MIHFLDLASSRARNLWALEHDTTVRLLPVPPGPRAPWSGTHRTSALFPLQVGQPVPSLQDKSWWLHFLVTRSAFTTLGRISVGVYPDLSESTWFGIGLASVVVIARKQAAPNTLLKELGDDLLAHELWQVTDGVLSRVKVKRLPQFTSSDEHRHIPVYVSALPTEHSSVMEEFYTSHAAAMRAARLYQKSLVLTLEGMASEATRLGQQVASLLGVATAGNPRDRASEGDAAGAVAELAAYDLGSDRARSRLIQQRTDRVVQVSGALSHVVSQSLMGAPPIAAGSSLVKRHSLLGIGRAHAALQNLVREIEDAFNATCIRESIVKKWKEEPPLAGFTHAKALCESYRWKTSGLPDKLLEDTPSVKHHKLAYFSGRLGFRDSEYSETAAIQSLACGDAAEWHLSTMTHELLHGHMRLVIGSIFSRTRPEEPSKESDLWEWIFDRFRTQMREGPGADFRLIDSVRNVLLYHCCLVTTMGSLTSLPRSRPSGDRLEVINNVGIPLDDRHFRSLLDAEDRNISEMLVHTLDLFYFYNDDVEHYVRSIWLSWRNVPQVLRHERQYVLRTLLAVASTFRDTTDVVDRFASARQTARQVLTDTIKAVGEDPVLAAAVSLFDLARDSTIERAVPMQTRRRDETAHPLFQPFLAAMPVVDLARGCLASKRVRGRLFEDDLFRQSEDGVTEQFAVETGQFVDLPIRSVAQFCAWRTRMKGAKDSDVERRTAWLFLACGDIK